MLTRHMLPKRLHSACICSIIDTMNDDQNMQIAIDEARTALMGGGIPIAACLADSQGKVIAVGHNERVQKGDPIAHGEIACLRNAGRQKSYAGYTLYTTLSPCAMCRGAIELFKIPRVVVGENETFAGDLDKLRATGAEVVLLDSEDCKRMMREFQAKHPDIWNEDIGMATT